MLIKIKFDVDINNNEKLLIIIMIFMLIKIKFGIDINNNEPSCQWMRSHATLVNPLVNG